MKILKIMTLAFMLTGVALAIEDGPAVTVPEIDGRTAVAAIGLAAGGLLVLRARRNRK